MPQAEAGLHVNYLAYTHCSNKQTTKVLFLLKTYPRWIGQLSESAVLKKWLRDLGSFHCVAQAQGVGEGVTDLGDHLPSLSQAGQFVADGVVDSGVD